MPLDMRIFPGPVGIPSQVAALTWEKLCPSYTFHHYNTLDSGLQTFLMKCLMLNTLALMGHMFIS